MESKIYSSGEVRKLFNITKPTELDWRKKNILPTPVVLGRRVYYSTDKINKLIENVN